MTAPATAAPENAAPESADTVSDLLDAVCPVPQDETVVILQGGGALGAYQGGVLEGLLPALEARGREIDWVVGTSIGAINAALVAGNPPQQRLERLHAFWDRVSQPDIESLSDNPWTRWAQSWGSAWSQFLDLPATAQAPSPAPDAGGATPEQQLQATRQALVTMARGVPGFFVPGTQTSSHLATLSPFIFNPDLPPEQVGVYDTSPLRETLLELVDFDWLNSPQAPRLTVTAVNIRTGQPAQFDSRHTRIGPEHIMASGALPPGFPPVAVEGELYWDGGIYSNSPLDILLEDPARNNTLCFLVDLWDAKEEAPVNLAQTLRRAKDIQFASRTCEQLRQYQQLQSLRRGLARLAEHLPDEVVMDPAMRELLGQACRHSTDIVHLTMDALPGDTQFKDIDFSQHTVRTRWDMGRADIARAMRARRWRSENDDPLGLRIHAF
ncbi:patatin-like phospholipase family protein [Amphibiibacter pelophylacis]|uniref:Patatin-like phospholipase family protein n=1 Tax=Amphibiibacter pelophylacis TaxID=1799477 RepID=A0ACC6NZA1_9BURK